MTWEIYVFRRISDYLGGVHHADFALLVLRAEDPARLHARAAVRLGASVADLIGVAETAFITGGVTAFSLGVRVAGEVAEATDTGGGASR